MLQAPYDPNIAVIGHSTDKQVLEDLKQNIIKTYSDDNLKETLSGTRLVQEPKELFITEQIHNHILDVAKRWTWDGVNDDSVIIEQSTMQFFPKSKSK